MHKWRDIELWRMQLNGVSLIILWHSDDFYYCNADSIEHSEGVTLTYNLIACSVSSREDLFMERAFTDVKCPHHHHSHRMLQIVMNCLLSSLVVHYKAYSMSFPHVNQSINLLFSTQIQRMCASMWWKNHVSYVINWSDDDTIDDKCFSWVTTFWKIALMWYAIGLWIEKS